MSFSEKKQLKRRGAIEATIGYMKSDGLLERSYLKGIKGNQKSMLFYVELDIILD